MTSSDAANSGQQLDSTSKLRIRIVQVDEELEMANKKNAELAELNKTLENVIVEKDSINAKLSAELHRLRQMVFGEADEEIKRLTQQMRYREEQIDELTAKCSLLESELERILETDSVCNVEDDSPKQPEKLVSIPQEPIKEHDRPLFVIKNSQNDKEKSVPVMETVCNSSKVACCQTENPALKQTTLKYLNDVEASAMIISSLNYELMRVMQENEAKESQLKEFEHECQLHAKDLQLARSKINYLVTLYSKLRAQTLTDTNGNEFTVSQIEDAKWTETEIRLIELERLANSIKTSGTETERQLEEGARKLIYVQIKAFEAERKWQMSEKLSKNAVACAERLKAKLKTLLTGENQKFKQLSREYELNMIQIVRLQNTLIHSVSLTQYNKLLHAYKSVAHKASLNVEYDFSTDLAFDSSTMSVANISANFNISPEHNASVIENLSLENNKLSEINEVLEAQNEYLQRQTDFQAKQINELNAFLTDIENQTELKVLIVNIERRFLQALQEQADTSDIQYFIEREVETLRKKLNLRQQAWRDERQNLVNVISGLQNAVQKLRAQTTGAIKIDQLIELRTTMEKLRREEAVITEKTLKLDSELANVEVQKALVTSQMNSIQDVVDADYNIQRLQKSMQGYQFNILVLSNEVKTAKTEISRLRAELIDAHRHIEETDKEQEEILLTQLDVKKLSQWKNDNDDITDNSEHHSQRNISMERQKEMSDVKKSCNVETSILEKPFNAVENSFDDDDVDDITISSVSNSAEKDDESRVLSKRTVIFDNSAEYERQIQQVKETARTCIKNFEDQLAQKEEAVNEYRNIVEALKAQIAKLSLENALEKESISPAPIEKRPSSILFDEATLKENITLNRQVKDLERANSDLMSKIEQLEDDIIKLNRHFGNATKKKIKKTPEQSQNSTMKPEEAINDYDFESINDNKDRDGAKTPIVEVSQNKQKSSAESDDEPSHGSSLDGSTSEEDSEEEESGTTDSGTVADIDEVPLRRPSRSNSALMESPKSFEDLKTLKESPKYKCSTETVDIKLPIRPTTTTGRPLVVTGDDRERIIYNQRNEIRRLRDRIMLLERKSRTLETERDAWRERNRFNGKKEQTSDPEGTLLKKENDRLRREIKNLSQSLENEKHEITKLQKAVNKCNTLHATKELFETWEDKKKCERSLSMLKKRIETLTIENGQLAEKLERREKYIEQLQIQVQHVRPIEHEKIQQLIKLLNSGKKEFEVREAQLKDEVNVWTRRNQDTLNRLETAFKEINALKIRNDRLQSKLKELELLQDNFESGILPSLSDQLLHSTRSATTSITGGRFSSPSFSNNQRKVTVSNAVQVSLPISPVLSSKQTSLPTQTTSISEVQQLNRKLRYQELRSAELTEQFDKLQADYTTLQESYTKMVRFDRMRESENIAVIPVLRDKLKAKDKEINLQRCKINELEKKLFYPQ